MKRPGSAALEDNVYMYVLEISDPVTYLSPLIHTAPFSNLGRKECRFYKVGLGELRQKPLDIVETTTKGFSDQTYKYDVMTAFLLLLHIFMQSHFILSACSDLHVPAIFVLPNTLVRARTISSPLSNPKSYS